MQPLPPSPSPDPHSDRPRKPLAPIIPRPLPAPPPPGARVTRLPHPAPVTAPSQPVIVHQHYHAPATTQETVIVIQTAPRTLLGSIFRGLAWLLLLALAAFVYLCFFPTAAMRSEAAARAAMRAYLYTPGQASFTFQETVPAEGGGHRMRGYVDSQNLLGATLRGRFEVYTTEENGRMVPEITVLEGDLQKALKARASRR